MIDGTDCTSPLNMNRYIDEFTCRNPEATEKVIKDMRLSFPSANSSFSFFTMVFCVVGFDQKITENKLFYFFYFPS